MKGVYIVLLSIFGLAILPAFGEEHHAHDHDHFDHHESYYTHDLPTAVVLSLGNRYNHFDLIHTRRVYRRGRLSFDLVLQHRAGFVRVSMGDRGHFYHDTYYDHYPLNNHYCDDYCGFDYLHYEGGNFVDYDPYYGCSAHVSLIVNRFPRYVYRPYYGYGSLYYHPHYRWYKRIRNFDPYYHRGYYVHQRPRKHYRYNNHNYGYKNGNRYGHYKNGRHGNGGRYQNDRRYNGQYQQRSSQRNRSQQYGHRSQPPRGSQGRHYERDHRDGDRRFQDRNDDRRHRQQGRYEEGRRQSESQRHQDGNINSRKRQQRESYERKRGEDRIERPRGDSPEKRRRRSS